MASKPASLPRWSETAGGVPSNIVEPSSGQKDTGWTPGQKPPARFFNWYKNLVYKWIQYLDDLSNQAFTWTQFHVFQKRVTVSAGVASNHNGLQATGDGSGAGVKGTGGDTAGSPGVDGSGGVGGGPGVKGSAIGTYPGVQGTGGGNAAGVKGTGGGSGGSGVEGIGGNGGAGGSFVGGGVNANGLTAVGTGTGTGVICAGSVGLDASGSGSGTGVKGTGGSGGGTGVTGTGAGGGHGVTGTGQGGGTGVVCTGGASGIGCYCSGNGGSPALVVAAGHAQFTGTLLAANVMPAFNNQLTGIQFNKAQLMLHKDNTGVCNINDGYNIDSAGFTVTSTYIEVTMLRAMADVNYGVTITNQDTSNTGWSCDHLSKTTTKFRLFARDADTGTIIDPSGATVLRAFIEVKGRQ